MSRIAEICYVLERVIEDLLGLIDESAGGSPRKYLLHKLLFFPFVKFLESFTRRIKSLDSSELFKPKFISTLLSQVWPFSFSWT